MKVIKKIFFFSFFLFLLSPLVLAANYGQRSYGLGPYGIGAARAPDAGSSSSAATPSSAATTTNETTTPTGGDQATGETGQETTAAGETQVVTPEGTQGETQVQPGEQVEASSTPFSLKLDPVYLIAIAVVVVLILLGLAATKRI